jgi:prolyl oligopeptidase PreP (S9A serine peptidase family)
MKITISQALRRISKLKGALAEALARAANGVNYHEAALPAYKFGDSIGEADRIREELVQLGSAMRITNAATKITFNDKVFTLTEATVRLQEAKSRITWLKGLNVNQQAEVISMETVYDVTTRQHVQVAKKIKCDLPEAERNKLVKTEQEAFDALNDVVETTNHSTTFDDNSGTPFAGGRI